MTAIARRAALSIPVLLLPASGGRAVGIAPVVPPFAEWIGRTALLRGDGAAARILLAGDGGGLLAVKLFLFCRVLPIRSWRVAPDGKAVSYTRVSALDSSRLIEGEAQILPGRGQVVWTEARTHIADFEGFAAAEAANRCA